jgi:hypothetical protein
LKGAITEQADKEGATTERTEHSEKEGATTEHTEQTEKEGLFFRVFRVFRGSALS